MKDGTGLLAAAVLLVLLAASTGGAEPDSGYCIGEKCFGVAQEPGDFATAQKQCKSKGGHLMTVRSLASHNVLLILLGNSTGRFWIGLHLSSGCPDADAAAAGATGLWGYQWVTQDDHGDFSNWAPGFDGSCSSPRCVSVSIASDFAWEQEACGARAAGFLCEFDFSNPCPDLTLAGDESVVYSTPMGIVGVGLASLPPGTIAIRRPSEVKYVCFSEAWLQAPWSCEIHEGGCEHKCAMDPKQTPVCYCPLGQTVDAANKVTCEVGVEDPCAPLRCEHACYQILDSYACLCDHGFRLAADGRSCVDFNDCSDPRQCPGDNTVCVNTVGGFECVCRAGYAMVGGLCADENECASGPCEHKCVNSPGSYACACYDGYMVDPEEPNKCKLHCGELECPAECDPNDASQCYCPTGYIADERGDQTFCIDINECEFLYCDQGCKNEFGDYVCSCDPGYELVGKYSCVKVDGWEESTAPSIPTSTSYLPHPGPTRRPSGVSVGAFVGIILCTVFVIVLLVFLAHHILTGRGKMESAGALTAREDEAHSLHHVTSDS